MAKFEVGDRVRVLDGEFAGGEVTVVECNESPICLFDNETARCWELYECEGECVGVPSEYRVQGKRYWCFSEDDLAPVSEVSVPATTPPQHTQVGGTHYASFAIQPYEFIDANSIPFLEGSVIKYLCRHKDKGGAEDLKKAAHYLHLCLQRSYNITATTTFSDEA